MLGIEPASWSNESKWKLDWLALPQGDQLFLLLAFLLAVFVGLWFLYRWEAKQLSLTNRIVLFSLRLGILGMVVFMLAEPILVLTKEEKIPSHLLVLVDTSQSMEMRDTWGDKPKADKIAEKLQIDGGADSLRKLTRLDIVKNILSDELLNKLNADGSRVVHLHSFSERFDTNSLDIKLKEDWKPNGDSTAIGSTLQQAQMTYTGTPIAGVLMVTDGQSTSGQPIDEITQSFIDQGIPVVTVGMGTTEGPRNALISKVELNPVSFVNDANQLIVHIQSQGMQDVTSSLEIEKRRNGGPWEDFAKEDVILNLDGKMQSIAFDFSEKKTGKIEFRAKLEDSGTELSKDDNVASGEIRIVRQRLNVLLVAGSTFPEVQFLRNTFLRDSHVNLSSWLMFADRTYEHPGDFPIRRLPITQEEMDEYDCVVLYDPDPAGWPVNFSELLTNFVTKAGGGLVTIAGEMQTSSLFDQQSDPTMAWLNLLPVIREPGLFRSQVQIRLSAQFPWKMSVTEQGKLDPIFRFSEDDEANERILESLPGMYWHFPITRAKPGATVLARHADTRMRNEYGQEVLMASQRVGPGWTIFIAFDSTYRWRYLNQQFFDGFWARVVDRAGRSKQLGGTYPFRLSTLQNNYRPGSQVKVLARFIDESQIEPGTDRLYGEVERGDDPPQPITLTPGNKPGEFAATFPAMRPGTYYARVWMGDEAAGAQVKAATLAIEVAFPHLEYKNPTLNRTFLESIASGTGGQFFEIDESEKIPDVFKMKSVSRQLEERQEIWDAPLFYVLFIVLILTEWIMRKYSRLV